MIVASVAVTGPTPAVTVAALDARAAGQLVEALRLWHLRVGADASPALADLADAVAGALATAAGRPLAPPGDKSRHQPPTSPKAVATVAGLPDGVAMGSQLATTDEVARRLRTSSRTVQRLALTGELRALRLGKRYRFRWADVDDYEQRLAA